MNIVKRPEHPTSGDTTIAVGDRVRSYDFPGVSSCYWIGKVVGINNVQGVYNIVTEAQVWEGEVEEGKLATVHPPLNGLVSIFGKTCGVQRMKEGETV